MISVDGLLTFSVFVLVVMQLVVIAMLQHVYANKNVKLMSDLLHAQSERLAVELQAAIREGTNAALAACEQANLVTVKISDLNERISDLHERLLNQQKEK